MPAGTGRCSAARSPSWPPALSSTSMPMGNLPARTAECAASRHLPAAAVFRHPVPNVRHDTQRGSPRAGPARRFIRRPPPGLARVRGRHVPGPISRLVPVRSASDSRPSAIGRFRLAGHVAAACRQLALAVMMKPWISGADRVLPPRPCSWSSLLGAAQARPRLLPRGGSTSSGFCADDHAAYVIGRTEITASIRRTSTGWPRAACDSTGVLQLARLHGGPRFVHHGVSTRGPSASPNFPRPFPESERPSPTCSDGPATTRRPSAKCTLTARTPTGSLCGATWRTITRTRPAGQKADSRRHPRAAAVETIPRPGPHLVNAAELPYPAVDADMDGTYFGRTGRPSLAQSRAEPPSLLFVSFYGRTRLFIFRWKIVAAFSRRFSRSARLAAGHSADAGHFPRPDAE